jgi:hypothetical protein
MPSAHSGSSVHRVGPANIVLHVIPTLQLCTADALMRSWQTARQTKTHVQGHVQILSKMNHDESLLSCSLKILFSINATSRKVTGLRPDEVYDFFFNLPNPSGPTMPWGLLSL